MDIPRRKGKDVNPDTLMGWFAVVALPVGFGLFLVSFLTRAPGLASPGAGLFLAGLLFGLLWTGFKVGEWRGRRKAAAARLAFPYSRACETCGFPTVYVDGFRLHQTREYPDGIPFTEDGAWHSAWTTR